MEKEKTTWSPKRHSVRRDSSQRFRAHHARRPQSASDMDGTVPTRKDGPSLEKHTVSGISAEDRFGVHDVEDRADQGPGDEANERDKPKGRKSWVGRTIKWDEKTWEKRTKKAGSVDSPQISPFTIDPKTGEKPARQVATDRRRRESLLRNTTSSRNLTVHRNRTNDGSSSEFEGGAEPDSKLQSSEQEEIESSDDRFQKSKLPNIPIEGDHHQGQVEYMKRHAQEANTLNCDSEDRDTQHKFQLQHPGSGSAPPDDGSIIIKDFGSWNPSNKQKSDHNVPESPEVDHSIDETSDGDKGAVSDISQKPDEIETLAETPHSSHNNEHDNLDSQPQILGLEPGLDHPSLPHDPGQGQFDLEININKEAPDINHSPSTGEAQTLNQDLQSESPGREQTKSPDSQAIPSERDQHGSRILHPNSPTEDQSRNSDPQPIPPAGHQLEGGDLQTTSPMEDQPRGSDSQPDSPARDQTNSLESQTQSPEPGGVTVETSPIQDQVEEQLGSEAWMNSDVPLARNYRASLDDFPSPVSTTGSRSLNDTADSLIVSPTRSDDFGWRREDYSSPVTNANIMQMLADYKTNSQLHRSPGEQEAEEERGAEAATDGQDGTPRRRNSVLSSVSTCSSDGSLIVSPDREDDASPTESETVQNELTKAKEEENSQAALRIYELYRDNYEMQKETEAREIRFKREIEIAWTHPRPPPTTAQQRMDKLALKKIEEKEIFDELGEQQRPIQTDPQLVLLETEINTMITRAQINYLLEDYMKMYTHANHVVARASQLRFPPLTARCLYYRGIASYHCREFGVAKDDFVASRGCAGFYGISSESIEDYIDKIVQADDPETAVIERFQDLRSSGTERTSRSQSTDLDDEDEPSPSSAASASTLVGASPTSPHDSAPSPSSSPSETGERSARKQREDSTSETQISRNPDQLDGPSSDGEPAPSTDVIPDYQPQEETISEEIRKDIFESKVQSLNPVSDAGPSAVIALERNTLAPPSMASTENTLLGSATTQGDTRRVPRPYVAPITTSFATGMNNLTRGAPSEVTLGATHTHEMDEDEIRATSNRAQEDDTAGPSHTDEMNENEIMAASNTVREDPTPGSDNADLMDEEEIMREFGAAKGGFIGAQGGDLTPDSDEGYYARRGWRNG